MIYLTYFFYKNISCNGATKRGYLGVIVPRQIGNWGYLGYLILWIDHINIYSYVLFLCRNAWEESLGTSNFLLNYIWPITS